ncbi:MAG: hemerythrin domain-containing protein [Pseudomonadota bacterium]|nr:hemerythrin domain-containing protein [Pseudomonadota bacterium]
MKQDQTKGSSKTTGTRKTTGASSAAGAAGRQQNASAAPDAITLLIQDHDEVKKMFKEYERLGDSAQASKQELAEQICEALTIHTQIEEEIFYPALREALDDDDMMDEADVEHAAAKELIEQIQGMDASESHYDAKVKVLGEEIEHHVKEEQNEMFAKAKKTKLDLKQLGQEMFERKAELSADSMDE